MMTAMDISTRTEFPAGPDAVVAMMTDEAYQTEVCKASGSDDYAVSVTDSSSRTERTLPAPEAAAKFTGSTIKVVEEISWHPGSGNRTGDITVTVPGQPVLMKGTVALTAEGAGSVFTVDGNLKVNIPLLGKKLEQAAAPAVYEAVNLHERVGREWLSR